MNACGVCEFGFRPRPRTFGYVAIGHGSCSVVYY